MINQKEIPFQNQNRVLPAEQPSRNLPVEVLLEKNLPALPRDRVGQRKGVLEEKEVRVDVKTF